MIAVSLFYYQKFMILYSKWCYHFVKNEVFCSGRHSSNLTTCKSKRNKDTTKICVYGNMFIIEIHETIYLPNPSKMGRVGHKTSESNDHIGEKLIITKHH